ncbi:tetratricopeptide repeat protein 39B-like isoform X2 [Epargyreus clarus]
MITEMKPFKSSEPRLDPSSSEEEDEFLDAVDEITAEAGQARYSMDLATSLEQCEIALNKFFNNDLEGAIALMKPWSKSSLYHSLATAIFEFIPAVLTLEPRQVDVAQAAVQHTLALCQQYRRSYSFVESLGTIIRKPNFSMFTELEAHAQLCYAEALLLQAALAVLDGEDLAGLVRATLRVKSSHSNYKTCQQLLEGRRWEVGRSRQDFESGVRLGLATFDVLISLLPARLISMLSYAGFTGDRAAGLAGLERGSRAGGLRAPLCDLTLLAVQLVVGHFVDAMPDMQLADRILALRLQQYPDGAWFLLFRGRQQLLRGQAALALATYERVAAVPRLWPQLQHLTYWESMWACSIELRWREAAQFAARLLAESAWSRTVYAYTRAAFLLQVDDPTSAETLSIAQLMGNAASYRQRIAGKSLPMEKFVARRCQRWAARRWLPAPGLELLALWNLLPALAADRGRARAAMQIVDQLNHQLRAGVGTVRLRGGERVSRTGPRPDSTAVAHFLRGALHAAMGRERDALPVLNRVLELKNEIHEDTFLVPYAMYEIACCHVSLGDPARGRHVLREIRRNFGGYLLESRLQFRVHSQLASIQEQPGEAAAGAAQELEEQARAAAGPPPPPPPPPPAPRRPDDDGAGPSGQ